MRLTAGMDLTTLSRRSGVSASYLSRLEAGKRGIPTLNVLVRLSRGLDAPLPTLLHLAGVEVQDASVLKDAPPFGLPASIRRALEHAVGRFSADDWRAVETVLKERLHSRGGER